jgi:hypothetical protein
VKESTQRAGPISPCSGLPILLRDKFHSNVGDPPCVLPVLTLAKCALHPSPSLLVSFDSEAQLFPRHRKVIDPHKAQRHQTQLLKSDPQNQPVHGCETIQVLVAFPLQATSCTPLSGIQLDKSAPYKCARLRTLERFSTFFSPMPGHFASSSIEAPIKFASDCKRNGTVFVARRSLTKANDE